MLRWIVPRKFVFIFPVYHIQTLKMPCKFQCVSLFNHNIFFLHLVYDNVATLLGSRIAKLRLCYYIYIYIYIYIHIYIYIYVCVCIIIIIIIQLWSSLLIPRRKITGFSAFIGETLPILLIIEPGDFYKTETEKALFYQRFSSLLCSVSLDTSGSCKILYVIQECSIP